MLLYETKKIRDKSWIQNQTFWNELYNFIFKIRMRAPKSMSTRCSIEWHGGPENQSLLSGSDTFRPGVGCAASLPPRSRLTTDEVGGGKF